MSHAQMELFTRYLNMTNFHEFIEYVTSTLDQLFYTIGEHPLAKGKVLDL